MNSRGRILVGYAVRELTAEVRELKEMEWREDLDKLIARISNLSSHAKELVEELENCKLQDSLF